MKMEKNPLFPQTNLGGSFPAIHYSILTVQTFSCLRIAKTMHPDYGFSLLIERGK